MLARSSRRGPFVTSSRSHSAVHPDRSHLRGRTVGAEGIPSEGGIQIGRNILLQGATPPRRSPTALIRLSCRSRMTTSQPQAGFVQRVLGAGSAMSASIADDGSERSMLPVQDHPQRGELRPGAELHLSRALGERSPGGVWNKCRRRLEETVWTSPLAGWRAGAVRLLCRAQWSLRAAGRCMRFRTWPAWLRPVGLLLLIAIQSGWAARPGDLAQLDTLSGRTGRWTPLCVGVASDVHVSGIFGVNPPRSCASAGPEDREASRTTNLMTANPPSSRPSRGTRRSASKGCAPESRLMAVSTQSSTGPQARRGRVAWPSSAARSSHAATPSSASPARSRSSTTRTWPINAGRSQGASASSKAT